jgi:vacuolar-type H+-ATPase subunit F/Vma7
MRGSVVALGGDHRLAGYVLAGVTVVHTATEAGTTDAWERLDDDVRLVILSADAAAALGSRLDERPDVLTVELP